MYANKDILNQIKLSSFTSPLFDKVKGKKLYDLKTPSMSTSENMSVLVNDVRIRMMFDDSRYSTHNTLFLEEIVK